MAFVRGLGVVYICAFVSLIPQLPGLYGPEGILPVEELTSRIGVAGGGGRYLRFPSLLWLGASDAMLQGVAALGAVAGCGAAFGRRPGLPLVVAWACYLSLTTFGRVFMGYQWDGLLLETGALALIYGAGARPDRRPSAAPQGAALLLRLLAIKLFFFSGFAKLASGDEAWRLGTALYVHFETQPLPTWVGLIVHDAPRWFLKSGVGLVFAIQLIAPWGLLAPWSIRRSSVATLVFLQLLIALTGNYGFFNLLAVVLLLPAVPDEAFVRWLPRDLRALSWAPSPRPADDGSSLRGRFPKVRMAEAPVIAVLGFVAALNVAVWLHVVVGPSHVPGPLIDLYDLASPASLVHTYGLFAVMTTERPEITVEGSLDGRTWKPFHFRFKPRPDLRPAFIAPHQPRLDWQMWFAALRRRPPPWFVRFVRRLSEGAPAVRGLLATDPFDGAPVPRVRARVEDCRAASFASRRGGEWWDCRGSRIYFAEPP